MTSGRLFFLWSYIFYMNFKSAAGQSPVILTPEIEANLALRLEHVAAGFSVIPLIDDTKLPAVRWEPYKTAAAPEEQVIDWMGGLGLLTRHKARPELEITALRNHGIVTGAVSGIVVLDLDDARAIRVAERLGLPETPIAATPRGRHIYFRHPGGTVTNGVDIFSERRKARCYAPDGFDVRGDGGFVVAPGSYFRPTDNERVLGGKVEGEYRWLIKPGAVPFADMPHWLIAILAYRAPLVANSEERRFAPIVAEANASIPPSSQRISAWANATLAACCQEIVDAAHGTQNNTIFRSAARIGSLIAGGVLDGEEAVTALFEAAHMGRHPAASAKATIKSGLATGQRSACFGPANGFPLTPKPMPSVTAAKRRLRAGGL
nr:bifunctional DNA primase/polymerase [Novosphingobium panipatense]